MAYPIPLDKPLGEYHGMYLAKARDESIRKRRIGSGGAVTALLLYMIEEGIVDAVVTARKTKGVTGEIVVAHSREELLEAAGNKWSVLPFTLKLKEALSDENIRRVAMVGLPCQAQFLWQMRLFPVLETDFSSKIYFIVSLFCIGTFATEAFLSSLHRLYGIEAERVSSINIVGDTLIIKYNGGEKRITLSEAIPYMQLGCLVCPDYTGIFSDLSAGISEQFPGYTILISRSDKSEKYLKDAAEKGYVEISKAPIHIVEEIEIKARAKMIRAQKYMTLIL